MRFQTFLRIATLSIATLASALSIPASADTYQIIDFGNIPNSGLYGITASGTVVIEYESSVPGLILYQVSELNGQGYTSGYPPNLDYDGGTECTPTTSSGVTFAENYGASVCNGSHEVYEGFFTPSGTSQQMLGIFTGPDLSDLLPGFAFPSTSGTFMNGLGLNSVGDFVFSLNTPGYVAPPNPDGYYEAVDLTTPSAVPEPGSFLLLGTGTLTALAAMRRRLFQ
jgi:PEP-CTERM motif